MGIAKYSPTVTDAYYNDQEWHCRLATEESSGVYDIDGYDSYGYDKNGIDRAGHTELEYSCDSEYIDTDSGGYWITDMLDQVSAEWGFNGIRPAPRGTYNN